MTEMDIGSLSTPTSVESAATPSSSIPSSSHAETASHNEAAEHRFTQSDLDRVAGKVRAETIDRMKRESSIHAERQAPLTPHYPEDHMRKIASESIEQARKAWEQDFQRKQQEEGAQRIAQDFYKKIETGKSEFPDFEEKMKELNYAELPEIVEMATHMDNTAAVMYELNENKWKMGNILSLMQRSPQLAFSEMKRLSESIKQNKNAQYESQPKSPLSQLRASSQGMDRGGVLTVSDYRKKFKT